MNGYNTQRNAAACALSESTLTIRGNYFTHKATVLILQTAWETD